MSQITPRQKAVLDAAVGRYAAAVNALDTSRFVACFRKNCVIRDPYGTSLYEGEIGVRDYIATLADTWQDYRFVPGMMYYGGHERVVFAWEVTATAHSGKPAQFGGIMVITLEGDLIDGLESYWDAAAMFGQIKG